MYIHVYRLINNILNSKPHYKSGKEYQQKGYTDTISVGSEGKYVKVRRFLVYIRNSIDKAIRWAVFEPNGSIVL